MVTSGAAGRRRDSDADVETRVFNRPPPFGLDRQMVLQIMRELEPQGSKEAAARPLPLPRLVVKAAATEPNVFLTPWATPDHPPAPWARPREETGPRVRVVRSRSKLPWFVGMLSFALAFGILNDPVVRKQTASQIKSAASHTYQLARSLGK
jgi:hypothetical protein